MHHTPPAWQERDVGGATGTPPQTHTPRLGGEGKVLGITWGHEVSELLRDTDALLRLVVLQDGADGAGGGTHRGVEHVHKLHLRQGYGKVGGVTWRRQGGDEQQPPPGLQPSSSTSPCPSSSWSVRSGCAGGVPGSRCSWSRTRARGKRRNQGTRPPGPVSYWQRG